MSKKITIGSRSSKLALIYAQTVKDKIIQNTNLQSEDILIKKINTKGDQIQDVRLSDVGGKGLFSKNIEKELKDRKEVWKSDVKAKTEFDKMFALGMNLGIQRIFNYKKPPSSVGAKLINWEKEGRIKYPGKDYIEPRANTALVNYVIGQIQKSYNNFKRNQTAQEKDYSTNNILGDAVKKTASVYMLSKFEGKHGQNFSTNSKDRGNVFDQIKNDYLNFCSLKDASELPKSSSIRTMPCITELCWIAAVLPQILTLRWDQ